MDESDLYGDIDGFQRSEEEAFLKNVVPINTASGASPPSPELDDINIVDNSTISPVNLMDGLYDGALKDDDLNLSHLVDVEPEMEDHEDDGIIIPVAKDDSDDEPALDGPNLMPEGPEGNLSDIEDIGHDDDAPSPPCHSDEEFLDGNTYMTSYRLVCQLTDKYSDIWVHNFDSKWVKEKEIRAAVSQYGRIHSLYIYADPVSGKSLGSRDAFSKADVEMKTHTAASRVRRLLHDTAIDKRKLSIDFIRPKKRDSLSPPSQKPGCIRFHMSNGRIVPLGDPLISGALGLKPYIAINYVDIPSHIRPLSSASHIPTPETVLYNLLKRTSDNYSGLSAQDKNLLLSLNSDAARKPQGKMEDSTLSSSKRQSPPLPNSSSVRRSRSKSPSSKALMPSGTSSRGFKSGYHVSLSSSKSEKADRYYEDTVRDDRLTPKTAKSGRKDTYSKRDDRYDDSVYGRESEHREDKEERRKRKKEERKEKREAKEETRRKEKGETEQMVPEDEQLEKEAQSIQAEEKTVEELIEEKESEDFVEEKKEEGKVEKEDKEEEVHSVIVKEEEMQDKQENDNALDTVEEKEGEMKEKVEEKEEEMNEKVGEKVKEDETADSELTLDDLTVPQEVQEKKMSERKAEEERQSSKHSDSYSKSERSVKDKDRRYNPIMEDGKKKHSKSGYEEEGRRSRHSRSTYDDSRRRDEERSSKKMERSIYDKHDHREKESFRESSRSVSEYDARRNSSRYEEERRSSKYDDDRSSARHDKGGRSERKLEESGRRDKRSTRRPEEEGRRSRRSEDSNGKNDERRPPKRSIEDRQKEDDKLANPEGEEKKKKKLRRKEAKTLRESRLKASALISFENDDNPEEYCPKKIIVEEEEETKEKKEAEEKQKIENRKLEEERKKLEETKSDIEKEKKRLEEEKKKLKEAEFKKPLIATTPSKPLLSNPTTPHSHKGKSPRTPMHLLSIATMASSSDAKTAARREVKTPRDRLTSRPLRDEYKKERQSLEDRYSSRLSSRLGRSRGRSTAFEVEDDDDYRPARKSSTIDRWSSDGPSDVDFSSRPRR